MQNQLTFASELNRIDSDNYSRLEILNLKSVKTKPTLKDIAAQLNLSPATVSNALNRQRGVNTETRERVLSTARTLGYKVDVNRFETAYKYIRFLIYKKHGLVIMDTPFFSELIQGISSECRKNGYELLVTHVNKNIDQDYKETISQITNENTMPILLLATEMDPDDIAPFLEINNPLVTLDSYFIGYGLNTVSIENYEAGYRAAEYFIKFGHKRMGFISSNPVFNNVRFRQNGFRDRLSIDNIELTERDVFMVEPTIEGSYRDMKDILESRREPMPTAIFAFNDIVASGSMRAMEEKGISVPEDISIIGMDNMPVCQITNPPLTTIGVPKTEMGAEAIRQLLQLVGNEETGTSKTTFLGIDIVERESVVAPKNGNNE
jgi:LacI family transcriptional regulator